MAYQLKGGCPACESEMLVTEYSCPQCGTQVRGKFQSCRFCHLAPELQNFITVFIVKRGNIKLVEKALGISYPTVRKMLKQVIQALGYAPGDDPMVSKAEKLGILAKLEKGEIDYATAMGMLDSGKEE